MWRRLAKHSFSIGLGQAINLAQQLLLPVAFLRQYGVAGYGAWLVVMAAVGQLGNLDFGLQTYLINRLTILYEAGRFAEFRRLQSIGLRVTLGLVCLGCVFLLGGQWLPVERWLNLDWPVGEARLVILLLGSWVMLRLIQGQLAAVLRATGQSHRAQHWDNLQRFLLLLTALLLLYWRVGFLWLAFAHVATALVAVVLVWRDTCRGPAVPTLREWDVREARQMVRPSLFFGLTTLNFLVLYEAPLLILQWTLGPLAVVTFATTRTLFSSVRQLLTPVQLAVQQELTRSYGGAEHQQLRHLYRFSESVALAGGCLLMAGLAVMSPWIIEHWLHGSTSPSPLLLALLAAVCLATIFKDNKYALPLATNRHERATLLILAGYLVMNAVAWWLTPFGREPILLAVWLVTELALAIVLQRQNYRQFDWGKPPLPIVPVGLTLALGAGIYFALIGLQGAPLLQRAGGAVLGATLAGMAALALLGDGLAKPARRIVAALNLYRQET